MPSGRVIVVNSRSTSQVYSVAGEVLLRLGGVYDARRFTGVNEKPCTSVLGKVRLVVLLSPSYVVPSGRASARVVSVGRPMGSFVYETVWLNGSVVDARKPLGS